MIHCILFKENGGKFAGIQLEGHSPSSLGTKGENLLCAGVSALVQSVHSYLAHNSALESELKRDGYLSFVIQEKERSKFQSLLEMVEFGIRNLKNQNPSAISLQYELIKG